MTLRLLPPERIALALLAVVVATLSAAWLVGKPVAGHWWLHVGLLAGYLALIAWLDSHRGLAWHWYARGLATIVLMFVLYGTIGFAAFDALPYDGDGLLMRADAFLGGGRQPGVLLARYVTPLGTEVMSGIYSAFIFYLYVSVLLGLVGRPDPERDAFVTGLSLTYAVAFLGYLFVPAKGPIVALASAYPTPLPPGPLHDVVLRAIAWVGGPHGAFPSLHVGASVFLCGFDLRVNRLRGLTYLPLVMGIAVATVYLRYHYVVDLIAGTLIALGALFAAPRMRREAAP